MCDEVWHECVREEQEDANAVVVNCGQGIPIVCPPLRKEPEVCYVTAHLTDSWFERYSWIPSRHHACMYQKQGVIYVRGHARSFTYIRRTFSRDDVQDQEGASGRSWEMPIRRHTRSRSTRFCLRRLWRNRHSHH
jgi:hypothetical protein